MPMTGRGNPYRSRDPQAPLPVAPGRSSVKPVLRSAARLLRLRLFRAGPAAGHTGESLARAVVRRHPRGAEDGALQRGRGDQLGPRGQPVLALRRLLLIDEPPDLLEHLLADEAGDHAAEDAEGDEDELGDARERSDSHCAVPGAGFEPARPEGQGILSPQRLTKFRHPGPSIVRPPRGFDRNSAAATVSRTPDPRSVEPGVEASALRHTARLPALAGRSPLLRLQSDEKLIALVRRGDHGAFEALVQRYQPRLLAFCRHMLGSQEDAEDVLQEVFAAAFNAICADDRPINARPWLYRIARNRCLNHLRRPQPSGQDSMDNFERDGGASTADTVHRREEFLHLVADVQKLPETQRTALLLREIDALSYDQIAETMDTTVPSVKSLLVRARVSLAEAAEARQLSCQDVRLELGEVAEGLKRTPAPVRRHLKTCDRCAAFKSTLRDTNKALAAIFPVGPLIFFKKLWLAKLGFGGASAASTGAGAGGAATGGAGLAGGAAAGGFSASSAVSAGVGTTIATKAAARVG